ncbi:Ig-like domain-containing protein [Methylomonas sp. WSC-6]|uniref:Ig-like domain-containing protein n=1 Tax=Methylomonas rivi TaxID=2952226 RepID=A0ABT1U6Z2_9GAMM|nr:Ig-like domain-containing protein [Methylomonas sp. WSC-6]
MTGVSGAINNVKGTLENIKDTVIYNFSSDNGNTVTILGKTLDLKNFFNIEGSLIVNIDEDLDGEIDATFTFKGDYAGKDISLSHVGADTVLTITTQTAPVATDDFYRLDEDSFVTGNFLTDQTNGAADFDADSDLLSLIRINGQLLSDYDDDLATLGNQIYLSSGAVLEIAANGTFTYSTNKAFENLAVGESVFDVLTYEISDQRREGIDSASVTFKIDGQNDAPEATTDSFTTSESSPITTGNVLLNDTDVDDDALNVSGLDLSETKGVVTDNGDGTFYYNPNDAFKYLGSGETATDSFVYTVSDGNGGYDEATVIITINGLAGPYTWYIDSDLDGFGFDDQATNQLAYEQPLNTSDVAGDADDTDDTVYPGAFDFNDHKDNNQDGVIDENNHNPVADDESFEVQQDSTLIIPVADLLAGDTDSDGDSLKVTGVSAAINGTVTFDDKGDADPTNDEIAFTPTAGFTGGASFEYTLSDGFGGADSGKVNLDVLSNEPSINSIIGTSGSDYLVGTNNPDLIRSLAGSYDRMLGGAGEDIFVFGEETYNGIRERDVIMDYEVGVDTIAFDNAADIGSIRATSTGAVIFMNDDLDAIYVIGQGVTPDNLTISTDLWL